jgi:hypothetical protein
VKRKGTWVLAAIALLIALAGCDVWLAVPLVVDPINQSVAVDEAAGGATASWILSGKGPCTVEYGDGTASTLDLLAEQMQAISHLYRYIGTYAVQFTYGRTVTLAEVTVTCTMPKIAVPFYLNPLVDKGQRITFNFTRRSVGCDNGTPQYFSGIEPGSGDTEFRVTGYFKTDLISLFDSSGANVQGEWIPLEKDQVKTQTLSAWAAYSGDTPVTPTDALEEKGATTLGCSGCCPPDPWPQPQIPDNAEYMEFTMTVRNQYMPIPSYLTVVWRIAVNMDSGCK